MENSRDIAIQITGLKKRYRLGTVGAGTLQADLQSWWAKIRGKEDPNLKIGQTARGKNEIFHALDGIDLTVYKGERIGIIGHNGAGKSTLLKLLSRVTAPSEGKICIDGRISSMLEVGTGFNPELTGRENVYLNGAILGMNRKEVDRKIDDIIAFSECGQFIDTPVKRYSSGMFVKLAFSVAAHLDNEILIMDEVLAVGDMAFQKKCLDKMSKVSQTEGRTILYVSHNMATIRRLCDRCIVMEKGKIIYFGEVEKAIELYLSSDLTFPIDYDYTKQERMPIFTKATQVIRYESLKIDKEREAIVEGDEPLCLDVKLSCKEEAKDIKAYVRIEIATLTNTIVGSTFTSEPMTIDEINNSKMYLNLSNLVNGDYVTVMTIYTLNENGTRIEYDAVNPAFKFSIRRKDTFSWNTQWWGNVKLPDITIK